MNRNRYRFLLGGHDLEMNGIGKMLRQNRKIVYDLHLSWGARLSSYIYVLNSEDTFVGIKLPENISLSTHSYFFVPIISKFNYNNNYSTVNYYIKSAI